MVVTWFTHRRLNKVKDRLERDDVAREMHDKDTETIQKQYEENREIRAEKRELLRKMDEMLVQLSRIVACKHYDSCPVRPKLLDYEEVNKYQRSGIRQHRMEAQGFRKPRSSPRVEGDTDCADAEPP